MNLRDDTFRGMTRSLLARLLLPCGHQVPFCTSHTLYRDGHVPLPSLSESRRSLTRVPS